MSLWQKTGFIKNMRLKKNSFVKMLKNFHKFSNNYKLQDDEVRIADIKENKI